LNEAAFPGRYRVPGASDIAAGAFKKLDPIPQFTAVPSWEEFLNQLPA